MIPSGFKPRRMRSKHTYEPAPLPRQHSFIQPKGLNCGRRASSFPRATSSLPCVDERSQPYGRANSPRNPLIAPQLCNSSPLDPSPEDYRIKLKTMAYQVEIVHVDTKVCSPGQFTPRRVLIYRPTTAQ
jgi:hypothetical protein